MDLANEFVVPRPIDQAWQVLTDVELIAPCLPGAQLTEVEGDTYRGVVKVKVGPILARFSGEARFVEQDRDNHRAVLDARGKEATGKGLASATVTAQLHEQGDSTRVEVTTKLTISGKIAQFGRGALADISSKLIDQFAQRLEETVLAQDSAPTPSDGPASPSTAEPDTTAPESTEPVATAGTDQPASGESDPADGSPAAQAGQPTEPAGRTGGEPDAAEGQSTAQRSSAAEPAAQPPASGGVRVIDGPGATPVNLLGTAGAPVLKRVVPLLVLIAVIVVVIVILATR